MTGFAKSDWTEEQEVTFSEVHSRELQGSGDLSLPHVGTTIKVEQQIPAVLNSSTQPQDPALEAHINAYHQ